LVFTERDHAEYSVEAEAFVASTSFRRVFSSSQAGQAP
jgi:hypothetical protein